MGPNAIFCKSEIEMVEIQLEACIFNLTRDNLKQTLQETLFHSSFSSRLPLVNNHLTVIFPGYDQCNRLCLRPV